MFAQHFFSLHTSQPSRSFLFSILGHVRRAEAETSKESSDSNVVVPVARRGKLGKLFTRQGTDDGVQ